MSDTTSNDQTSTAIVAKDDISVIAKMVLVSEKEKRDALARVMAERDIAVCAGKIFCNQLVAMTSDPADHEKFLGMYQTAKTIAENDVTKSAKKFHTMKIVDDLDDPTPTKQKRKPPSNGGITAMSAHHMHNAPIIGLYLKGRDVLEESNEMWGKLDVEDKATYGVLADAFLLFRSEKPGMSTKAIKEAWRVLGKEGKMPYMEKVAVGVAPRPIPDLPERGSGGAWDARWARRVTGTNPNVPELVDDDINDSLDDNDDTQQAAPSKKAKKSRAAAASS